MAAKRRRKRGLGSSDYAHGAAAERKLRDLDTVLDSADRTTRCNSLLTYSLSAGASWGETTGHLRSLSDDAQHDYPNLNRSHERARVRLVKLHDRIRQCFCKE
jgi:hypothetical protein